jgi:glycosyltransferase involved in cell wall biosynthesis
VFNRVVSLCSAIAVEGTQYTQFIENIRPDMPLYLPNFVARPAINNPRLADPGDTIALVHLGRLIKDKGIETAIQTKRCLERHNLPAELTIVGTGEPQYLAYLKETYPDEGIVWTGAIAQERVRETIRGSHFFIFPTGWWGEGHSNALNECMAEGVVPVCSDNGFNGSVVGDAGRILPGDATAEIYAREVAEIWKSGTWPELSRKGTERVRKLFEADVVVGRLVGLYEALSKS